MNLSFYVENFMSLSFSRILIALFFGRNEELLACRRYIFCVEDIIEFEIESKSNRITYNSPIAFCAIFGLSFHKTPNQ